MWIVESTAVSGVYTGKAISSEETYRSDVEACVLHGTAAGRGKNGASAVGGRAGL